MNDANSHSMADAGAMTDVGPVADGGRNVGIDPITLSIVWSKLMSIVEEMGVTIRRTAYSPAVSEGDDFSTGLFDRKGRLIAQGQFSPAHIGAMPNVIRNISKYIPVETLVPGDVVLFNDSTLGSGHFPDFFLIMPVFLEDRLVGYSGATAHHIDTGGATPGSQEIAGVSEAYQEGLRLLPVRLYRAGELDEDILRVIRGNVRVPDLVQGDLFAQRNAVHVGMTRVLAVYEEYGEELIENTLKEILIASESRMREFIREMPDGSWEFEDFLDDAGPGSDPVRFHVRVTIDDGDIEIDFSGGNDQVPAGINSYYNFTRAWGNFTTMALARAVMPQNEGTIRPIKVTARGKVPFSMRSIRRRRVAAAPTRCACSKWSMVPSLRRCPIARWEPSRTGAIPTLAGLTTGPASHSSSTTFYSAATAASTTRTARKAWRL